MIVLGIGCGADTEKVVRSAEQIATADIRVRCYCSPDVDQCPTMGPFVELVRCSVPCERIVDDLVSGKIDAAVRGTLPANQTLRALKTACGVSRLERIALLETADHRMFFLAPVGVDEGWTIGEKVSLVQSGRDLARRFGLPEKTAVLSGGRLGDIGRHPIVDTTIANAEEVARITGAVHKEILIEDAVRDCGVIIAPDGISGNLIFRTLTFLGNGCGHGAPVVNIHPVFVDSSRASTGYEGSLRLAASLALAKKQ